MPRENPYPAVNITDMIPIEVYPDHVWVGERGQGHSSAIMPDGRDDSFRSSRVQYYSGLAAFRKSNNSRGYYLVPKEAIYWYVTPPGHDVSRAVHALTQRGLHVRISDYREAGDYRRAGTGRMRYQYEDVCNRVNSLLERAHEFMAG